MSFMLFGINNTVAYLCGSEEDGSDVAKEEISDVATLACFCLTDEVSRELEMVECVLLSSKEMCLEFMGAVG